MQIIAQAFAQIGLNLSPAILALIMKYALESYEEAESDM